ncbi:site-2 protease family protein [Thermogemmatispora sp.]|uniref:site-2 protease family protein n=1 Tax=Thermogemmatispora sp. TaxID=1968838 RepID=UPI001D26F40B|nr:site-2 protease family protein [Thermogemmatispora sp.]MBX5448772.1 site-2 protease family protein [Thermogemmatispora sp.]
MERDPGQAHSSSPQVSRSELTFSLERSLDYTHPDFYRLSPDSLSIDQTTAASTEQAAMQPYRGPEDLAGYGTATASTGEYAYAARVSAEERGKVSSSGIKGKKGWAGLGGSLAALVALLLKFQWLGWLLKFGWAGISALISLAFYAMLFGWAFGLGIVVLLFVHELGHALVIKAKGIPLGGMIFIPLLGAAVLMKRHPQNARDDAEIGIAGPLAGALGSASCLLVAWFQPLGVWAPLAYFGFFINLVNLIPAPMLDGGRIVEAIDRRLYVVGLLLLLAYQIWLWLSGEFSPWLLLLVIIGATWLWTQRSDNLIHPQHYYAVPLRFRLAMTVAYFGLIALLIFGMSLAQRLMLPYYLV